VAATALTTGGAGARAGGAAEAAEAAAEQVALLRLVVDESSLLSGQQPAESESVWLLQAALCHWLYSRDGWRGASQPPPSLLRTSLRLMHFLGPLLAAAPAAAALRRTFQRAVECGWRQVN